MGKIKVAVRGGIIDGKQVSFRAPCNSAEATGLIINDVDYDVVSAIGNSVLGVNDIWAQDAIVSVILNTVTNKAYIQNPNAVGFLPLDGSKNMTGDLCINKGGTRRAVFSVSNNVNIINYLNNDDGTSNAYSWLQLYPETYSLPGLFKLYAKNASDESGTGYNIYGEHNKPSGSFTGNGKSSRTVTIGGLGTVLALYNIDQQFWMFVTLNGAFAWVFGESEHLNGMLYMEDVTYKNKTLTIGDSSVNMSGQTYYYQAL